MAATSSRVREASSVPPPRPQIAGLDRKGVLTGAALVVVLLVLVYIGSEGLRWFDAALAGYLVGTLLAVFAVAYRYVVWIERPPTRTLRMRGWQAFWGSGRRLRSIARFPDVLWGHLVGQGFIRRRSFSRWFAHQCLFWGCILAALVTFPLTFGWLHFEQGAITLATRNNTVNRINRTQAAALAARNTAADLKRLTTR